LHAEHAIAALNAGKHVFLEKPMAITIEDCDAILAAARRTGMKLYVGHNMRFFPVVRKMRELIEAGRIGRVEAIWCRHFISYGGDAYFKDWHSERRNITSLLLQKGAHDIDVIHYLAGGYTRSVVGMGKLSVYNEVTDRRQPDEVSPVAFTRSNWPPSRQKGLSPVIDVEDHNMILMQLDNGVQASYQQCHYTPDDIRNYTVIGTEGRIENYGDHSSDEWTATIHLWNSRRGYAREGNEVFEIPNIEGSHGGADPLLLEDFVNFLRGNSILGATPLDARAAVATGCLGAASLRDGSMPRIIPSPAGSGNAIFDEGT
jgi:predicted dehydrogenase